MNMGPGGARMKTNTPATLYNRYYDPDTKLEVFQRKLLPAVMWEDRKYSRVVQTGGRLADYTAMIYIPFSYNKATFAKPKAWLALEDKSNYWTIQEGDLLVKGDVADVLNAGFTPSDLKRKYDDVLSAIDIYTYDMGSYALQHWKVGAK